jgi:hypothetical protein
MPLSLFENKERIWAYLWRFFFLWWMLGFWFFSTQFFLWVMWYSSIQAWLAFLATSIPNFIVAIKVSKLTKKFWNKNIILVWLIISVFWLFLLSCLNYQSVYLEIAFPLAMVWIWQWLTLSPITISWIAWVESKNAWAASWVVNVAHQLWWSLGLSILVFVFSNSFIQTSNSYELLAHRITNTYLTSSILIFIAFVLVIFLIPKNKNI